MKCCSERSFFNSDLDIGFNQVHETQAGAVADCFKHLVLVALLQNLQVGLVRLALSLVLTSLSSEDACLVGSNANRGDDRGIFYVDTHAGAGLYEVKALYDPNSQKKS